jgi:hypothetical protein
MAKARNVAKIMRAHDKTRSATKTMSMCNKDNEWNDGKKWWQKKIASIVKI